MAKDTRNWHSRHTSDPYVKLSKRDGYRSRAAYKLLEIHQAKTLFRPGMVVVDLGAAPGGWSQISQSLVGAKGRVVALDILEMDPIPGVDFIQGDMTDPDIFNTLQDRIGQAKVDLVISDMAPNLTGIASVDQAKIYTLAEYALEFAQAVLGKDGKFLIKVFHGSDFNAYREELRQIFQKVFVVKPKASKDKSSEIYLLAQGIQL